VRPVAPHRNVTDPISLSDKVQQANVGAAQVYCSLSVRWIICPTDASFHVAAGQIFEQQGKALDKVAKKNVKVMVSPHSTSAADSVFSSSWRLLGDADGNASCARIDMTYKHSPRDCGFCAPNMLT